MMKKLVKIPKNIVLKPNMMPSATKSLQLVVYDPERSEIRCEPY
jgi:hypothetical protein